MSRSLPSTDSDKMPEIRREAEERRKQLLSGTAVIGGAIKVSADESPIVDDSNVIGSSDDVVETIPKPAPKPVKRHYKSTLESSTFKMEFDATDISVSEYQLALRIPRTGFKFMPKLTQDENDRKFILNFQDRTYNVIYAGGIIDFPTEDSWTIAFLVASEEDDDDKDR